MTDSLYKYLILHKQLALPGIGLFQVEEVAAQLDFVNKLVFAPRPVIRFQNEEVRADRSFFAFLSLDLGLNELDAIQQFSELVLLFKQQLLQSGQLVLPHIGALQQEAAGAYSFEPERLLNTYLPDINAERVMRKEAHMVRVGENERSSDEMTTLLSDGKRSRDNWWIFAIILALLGIGAVLYYYTKVYRVA